MPLIAVLVLLVPLALLVLVASIRLEQREMGGGLLVRWGIAVGVTALAAASLAAGVGRRRLAGAAAVVGVVAWGAATVLRRGGPPR